MPNRCRFHLGMAGVLSWIVAGAGAVALARLVPHRRRKLLWEALGGSVLALAAGLLATALDFGGTAVLDFRAVLFAVLAAAAGVAAVRLLAGPAAA